MTLDPARWLVDHATLLPAAGDALDVASGNGRNAIWLAQRGLNTLAIDREAEKIAAIRRVALDRGLPLHGEVVDLESDVEPDLPGLPKLGTSEGGSRAFDVIVVVHYLHRPLFPALRDSLRPGGMLVYETFTRAQARRGRPTNPAFLLEPGELRHLVAPLEIVAEREGDFEGKMLASVIAVRPRGRARVGR
ncbi:MAG TPA: methyltransferase domain-containing protein [Gemmatimonadaceae bacterium]